LSPDTTIYQEQVRLLLASLPVVADEEVFALKGGTAINLFIRDLPRLSVDIDLTYLPVHERSQSLEEISFALARIAARIENGLKGVRVIRLRQRADEQISKLQVQRADTAGGYGGGGAIRFCRVPGCPCGRSLCR
jgi:hypothetical protein